MTENESRKIIAKFCEDRMNFARGKDMSDKDLEDFCKFSDALTLSMSSLEEIQQYRAIGTVEECREAKERQRAKKPIMKPFYKDMEEEYLCCPACGDILTDRIPMDNKDFYFHCLNCGQKLDWSDTP